MKIIRTPKILQQMTNDWIRSNLSIGLVPTMGALHEGHASLINKAKSENDRVILSIFVNPTQFNQQEDFEKYPKTIEADLALAQKAGVDLVFMPENFETMYPDQYNYRVVENDFSQTLCGAHRPGHFTGVLTIVLKLLILSRCHRAYFGEKDYQQLELVRGLVKAFFLPVTIVNCPTMRESSGLALSSRNRRLSDEGRKKAATIYQMLKSSQKIDQIQKQLEGLGFQVEYAVERDGRRFIAAWLEGVRLIDNIPWEPRNN